MGFTIRVLSPGKSGPGSNPEHCVMLLGLLTYLLTYCPYTGWHEGQDTLTVPLSTQGCKWVIADFMLGGGVTLQWISIPSREK